MPFLGSVPFAGSRVGALSPSCALGVPMSRCIAVHRLGVPMSRGSNVPREGKPGCVDKKLSCRRSVNTAIPRSEIRQYGNTNNEAQYQVERKRRNQEREEEGRTYNMVKIGEVQNRHP